MEEMTDISWHVLWVNSYSYIVYRPTERANYTMAKERSPMVVHVVITHHQVSFLLPGTLTILFIRMIKMPSA